MKGYKGFDKDMKCRGMQFEVGKTYEVPQAVLCEKGLHFCEHPLDCLLYYKPGESVYAETVAAGEIAPAKKPGDSKRCSTRLTIKAEMTLAGIIKAAVDYIRSSCEQTTGEYAHAATTGGSAHAATTGGYAHAATTGWSAHAATTGKYAHAATTGGYAHAATTGGYAHAAAMGENSIAASIGYNGAAKAALNNWIVVAEYGGDGTLLSVRTAKVDGETIKADTFYRLVGGEFVEAEPKE